MRCVVATWHSTLDRQDRAAFKAANGRISRADLYAAICVAHGQAPFGLTALKQHLNLRCCCN